MWEDENGTTQIILQGEGGEQGDALMPLLFAVGQHAALVAVQGRLQQDERIFAFLDDIYTTSDPDRVGAVYAILQEELHHHCGIRIHTGKYQVWNQGGVRPPACDALELIAQREHPEARVWKGSDLSTASKASKCWGHHWDTQISSPPTLMAKSKSTSCSCPGSPQCQTCNQPGRCWSTAPVPGPRSC